MHFARVRTYVRVDIVYTYVYIRIYVYVRTCARMCAHTCTCSAIMSSRHDIDMRICMYDDATLRMCTCNDDNWTGYRESLKIARKRVSRCRRT